MFNAFSTGASLSDQVHQTPADMFRPPGVTAKLSCFHTISSYDQILWYRRSQSGQLQLLGYMTGVSAFPENGVLVQMEGSADANKNSTLTTEKLDPNSSAVYFCAARLHSVIYPCLSAQKPHHHTFYHLCITVHTPPSVI